MTLTCLKTRKRYDIRFYELNSNLQLKESQFMLFLQDVATENAELNGFGPTFTLSNNYGWFLLKYRIELTKYPDNLPYIELETMPRGASKLFVLRDFIIYAPNNEEIGRVNSTWALIDMNTHKMLSVPKVTPDFPIYEKSDTDLVFNKIRVPESFTYEKSFQVRFDDLDVNQHANNSNFIAWALEALPSEYRKENRIKNLDMLFKKDIPLGEIVLSKVFVENNTTTHVLFNKSTGEELTLINVEWDNT